jgi:Arc/MetJ-type ribon-helix-helix transcriptional regulator
MDQADKDHIQHEIESEANDLFAGWIRRVEVLQHDDAPWMEPGQLMPRLVFKDPAGRVRDPHPDPRKVAKAARTFKLAVGPGLNQFRQDLQERWPEIRYIEVMQEDDSGQRVAGNIRFVEDGRMAADGEFTHVMIRLRTPELDIVDTLVAAGIASNRAEAIRWALTRIGERPAYEQLRERTREHTRDIERLKSEF